MYPNVPYEGLSWPITQHAGILSNDVLDGLLNACLQCREQKADPEIINNYLRGLDIVSDNIRTDSNKADAWRDYQQILSEFGLIYSTRLSKEIRLTPVAMAYLNKRLNYEELITLQIMRYQYPNGHKSQLSPSLKESYGEGFNYTSFTEMQANYRILVRPAVTVWLVLHHLWKSNEFAVLSLDEMQNYIIRCTNHSDVSLCVESLLAARREDLVLPSLSRARRNAQDWFKILNQTPLFTLSEDGGNLSFSDFSIKESEMISQVCNDLSEQSSFWVFNTDDDFKREWFDFYGDFDNSLNLIIKTERSVNTQEREMLNFNGVALKEIIEDYKKTFDTHRPKEQYKWEAVKVFDDCMKEDSDNPIKAIKAAFKIGADNLLSTQELIGFNQLVKKHPALMNNALIELYAGETVSIVDKVKRFLSEVDEIANADEKEIIKHNQTERAVSVYLFLYDPESNYIYNRYGHFTRFAKTIEYSGNVKGTGLEKLQNYYAMCDELRAFILKDAELLKMNSDNLLAKREGCYQDEKYRLLTDDIIYFEYYYRDQLCNGWVPSEDEYHPGISKEQWIELWNKPGFFTDNAKRVMLCFLAFEHGATCTQVSLKYGNSDNYYNKTSSSLAEKVYKATDCKVYESNGRKWYFHILFFGKDVSREKDEGSYSWKMRHELREALEELGVKPPPPPFPLPDNHYYSEIIAALKNLGGKALWKDICDNIEEKGTLSAIHSNDTWRQTVSSYLQFKCSDSRQYKGKEDLFTWDKATKMWGLRDYEPDLPDPTPENDLPNRPPRQSKIHPMNVILYGAPGTGKTHSVTEYAMAIIESRGVRSKISTEERKTLVGEYKGKVKAGQIVFTTFHQSYGYEDFIQGIRPVLNSRTMEFANVDGVFKRLVDIAMRDNENNYVLIIDEINRANISKVFGELITLIEADKRWGESDEMSVTLPSGGVFAIPNNLYIVGTMNSADKSISLIDTALRRRFDFIEIPPDASLIADPVLRQVLTKLNTELFEELDSTDLLIGHAYFIAKTEADLVNIMNRNIIPLLYEYFFDNSKKVKAIVNKVLEALDYRIESESVGRIRIIKKD